MIVGKISDHNLMQLKHIGIPIVLVDFTSLCAPFDCVLTHNRQGGYMMCDYLVKRGYKKIGFFGDLNYSFSFRDRFLGFQESLVQNQIVSKEDVDDYIEKYSFVYKIERHILDNNVNEIKKILESKNLPDVLMCANDSNAFAVILALTQMGIKIPEEIGVVGFDDTPLCEKAIPKITTVQVQKEMMGKVGVSNLIDRIHRKDNIPITALLSVKIIERDSIK